MEDIGIDGRIMLKHTLKKENERSWTGLIWLMMGRIGLSCGHSDESSGFS